MNDEKQSEDPSKGPFNPIEHFIQIKSGQKYSNYLPVQWRLVWFRSLFPQGTIETEMVLLDLDRDTEEEGFAWNNEKRRNERVIKHSKGFVIFRATVRDGLGGIATATKSEKAASFPDFIEKAETGATGRALAMLGYGTQFTGDELQEHHRIVDAPVQEPSNNSSNSPQKQSAEENALITERQIASVRKLCEYLSQPEPSNLEKYSFINAKDLIQHLSEEYKAAKPTATPVAAPATAGSLQSKWAEAYAVPPGEIEDRWNKFVTGFFQGAKYAGTPAQDARLNGAIEAQSRRVKQVASVG